MRAPLPLVLALALGCASSPIDRAWLAQRITERTGHPTRPAGEATTATRLPPGVSLDDGVTEDEAARLEGSPATSTAAKALE